MSSCAAYIQEASCPNLRKVLISQFNQSCNDQYNVFDQMRQKGYYVPKDADEQEVKQVKNNFKSMQKQLE